MHVVGTAGHVDHGKSTLVRALTGIEPDRFSEEKRRGLTIDLGFAWCTLPSGRVIGIVDVPGHERFIRNMLAGVGGIDAVLFVVAADEGWMPQSDEHLQILDFLGVRHGLVALTKVDVVSDDLAELAAEEVTEHLAGTSLDGASVVKVAAPVDQGVDDLTAALDELLSGVPEAPDRGRPRLFVDRSFTITGAGTVVTGTLTGGRLGTDDEVEILPGGRRVRIRSLQTHGSAVATAVPGSRVAANLVGVERDEIGRGDTLALPGSVRVTDRFAATLRTARHLVHPFSERGAYELFVGSSEVPCRIKFLTDPDPPPAPDADGGAGPAAELLVEVFCDRALPVDPLDRFVVRDLGRWETVAGGTVLDTTPGTIRRGDGSEVARLRAREGSTPTDLVVRLIAEGRVVPLADLAPRAGAAPAEVADALEGGETDGRFVVTPTYVVDADHAAALEREAVRAVTAFHEAHPLEAGMPREELRRVLDLDPRAFPELLGRWGSDQLVAEGAVVKLPGAGTELAPDQQELAERAVARLQAAGATPPDPGELGLGTDLLRALERRGDVVVVGEGIAFARRTLDRISAEVARLIDDEGPVTVARVRDAIGTTRKYAVPLLEHLDSSGVTRRRGDVRELGPRGRELLGGRPL